MAAAKERSNAKREPDKRQRDPGRFRKESVNAARAPDGEREIADDGYQRDQDHQQLAGHGAFASAKCRFL